jgi:hypothetical protein
MFDEDDDPSEAHRLYGEVNPVHWLRSSIGDAYHSGVSYDQLWWAIMLGETPEQIDAGISAAEQLNIIVKTPTSKR